MIIAPALMLQPKADAFRLSSTPPGSISNPSPRAGMLATPPTAPPPLFLPAQGTAGIKLAVSRIRTFGGQFRPAGYPAPGRKIRRASITPPKSAQDTPRQLAVTRQPAALLNGRPWWESYQYD